MRVHEIASENAIYPVKVLYPIKIEDSVRNIESAVQLALGEDVDARWVSLKLLEGDESILEDLQYYKNINLQENLLIHQTLEQEKASLLNGGIDTDTSANIVSAIVAKRRNCSKKCHL